MVKYSNDLIEKVKELFPESEIMITHALNGNEFLGRYLDDSSSSNPDVKWLLEQTDISVIHEKARQIKNKRDLYKQWSKEVYGN